MTEVEQPPQNGIDPTAGDEDDSNKARPADIEQDMREMERRKRVEAIMGSKLFREELERIVDSAREGGAGASGILQQLSDIVGVPVNRVGSVFKSSNCMVPINDIRGVESMGYAKGEKILRCKLAATFRLLDLYGWTQGLGAQITARLKVDQEYFLVNPYGLLYHEVTASALNKVDMQGHIVEQGTTNFGVNKSHFVLHSVVHAARPDIRCAIYIGCSPVVAISSLKTGLLPLTKDACVLGEITTHAFTGLFDEEERNRLVRSLGPNSKVMLLSNHGALCCGETIEEAFHAACHIVQACETQLKLLPVGVDNLVLIPEESRKAIYEQSRRPPEDLEKKFAAVSTDDANESTAGKEEATPKIGSPPKWRVGGAEYEALMRMLDNAGYRTGYIYRHPLIKSDPPKPKNDVELPPAVSSLGYLLEEEEMFRQGIWKKGEFRKGGDRSRWLNSPNVYQKVEVLETGTPDPKKITKWVAEESPTHSTPVRIEDPLQFVPAGTTTKEFKRVQQQIKDNRRADKISAGPQSHILEGVTWDEANRIKDATVSQAGDHVVLMGAASKGIIQRGFQHNATVYKAPYAKNPFDNVTDDELNEYKRTVERKKKSIHGEYTDTDFSESEALNSMQAAAAQHTKHAQSEPETEHQVIQIQTQQAPIPSQAEVVLSDEAQVKQVQEVSDDLNLVEKNDSKINEEQEKEKQQKATPVSSTSTPSSSQFYSFSNNDSQGNLLINPLTVISPNFVRSTGLAQTENPNPNIYEPLTAPILVQLLQPNAATARCGQPIICGELLKVVHHLQPAQQHRRVENCVHGFGTGASSTYTATSTGSLTPTRRSHIYAVPYRTHTHFGFLSPRQLPQAEHKHLPQNMYAKYRPISRAISYEEIFSTPRYDQLCRSCFERLIRCKPDLMQQRQPASSSSCSCYAGESVSNGKTTPPLETHPKLADELLQHANHAKTQSTNSSSSVNRFLLQIEKLNFSEESANASYEPGLQLVTSDISIDLAETSCSAPASATSMPPPRVYAKNVATMTTDITEVWNFGNWQQRDEEQQTEDSGMLIQEPQQPLTEHSLTLEIKQNFGHDETVQAGMRQLMSRDERQRRKSEFQELWEDHVDYFTAKEEQQFNEQSEQSSTLRKISLDPLEAQVLLSQVGLSVLGDNEVGPTNDEYGREKLKIAEMIEPTDVADAAEVTKAAERLPDILDEFEQSLSTAGKNLVKLISTTRKLQNLEMKDEHASKENLRSDETNVHEHNGHGLYRSISLENISTADDMISLVGPSYNTNNASNESVDGYDEKRDDEKQWSDMEKHNFELTKEKDEDILDDNDVTKAQDNPFSVYDNAEDLQKDEEKALAANEEQQVEKIESKGQKSGLDMANEESMVNVIEEAITTNEGTAEEMHLASSSENEKSEEAKNENKITTTKDNVFKSCEEDIQIKQRQAKEQTAEHLFPKIYKNAQRGAVEEIKLEVDAAGNFSPLEREILERIEANKLKEREEIFGKIDHSIRNKLTPTKLKGIVGGLEETFQTCTHIYKTPPKTSTPTFTSNNNKPEHNNDTSRFFELKDSSSSDHNSSEPCCSKNVKHAARRLSRSCSSGLTEFRTPPPLKRTISSSTFISRPRPWFFAQPKRRNFILENIRNASKPRVAKPNPLNVHSSIKKSGGSPRAGYNQNSSPVCTFKTKQQTSGERLWVSMVTSPRSASKQPNKKKRKSPARGRKVHHRDASSDSSTSLKYELHSTISSSTYFVAIPERANGAITESLSSTTFEYDIETAVEEYNGLSRIVSTSGVEQSNNASNSFYYSADDENQDDVPMRFMSTSTEDSVENERPANSYIKMIDNVTYELESSSLEIKTHSLNTIVTDINFSSKPKEDFEADNLDKRNETKASGDKGIAINEMDTTVGDSSKNEENKNQKEPNLMEQYKSVTTMGTCDEVDTQGSITFDNQDAVNENKSFDTVEDESVYLDVEGVTGVDYGADAEELGNEQESEDVQEEDCAAAFTLASTNGVLSKDDSDHSENNRSTTEQEKDTDESESANAQIEQNHSDENIATPPCDTTFYESDEEIQAPRTCEETPTEFRTVDDEAISAYLREMPIVEVIEANEAEIIEPEIQIEDEPNAAFPIGNNPFLEDVLLLDDGTVLLVHR